jgi:putative transposase
MGQSLTKNYLHIVFSTKLRQPLITEDIENELFAYLGGICNELECKPIKIGGYLDHIHVLCNLSKKIALAKFMELLKANSSKWIKTKGNEFGNFYWQDGYGAFSVSEKDLPAVVNYISNQKEHHKNKDFKNEFRSILKKYNVEYDERYVWE